MSDDDPLPLVLAAYGLTASKTVAAGGTAGRTWRVTADGRDYFVRRRGSRTASPERVAFDQGLRRYLADRGFCATPALPTRTGDVFVRTEDGVYEVYPWVEGAGLSPAIAERARVPAAVTLAHFHRLAADYPAPCEPLVPQFGHFPVDIAPRPRFDDPGAFLEVAEHMLAAYQTAANRAGLERASERIAWFARAYGDLYAELPRGVIHGDYNGCNLLFRADGEVVGVFDYDWAWRDVRVRDVGEGVFFFGARRSEPPDGGSIWSLTACPELDTDAMAAFVRAYHAAAPLAEVELRAVPLAMVGRWIACRTEGVMKVPEERRAEFYLASFEAPFEWYEREGEAFLAAVA